MCPKSIFFDNLGFLFVFNEGLKNVTLYLAKLLTDIQTIAIWRMIKKSRWGNYWMNSGKEVGRVPNLVRTEMLS